MPCHATKFITSDYNSSYTERLKDCELAPLSYRRDYLDQVFIFCSLNNFNDYDHSVILNAIDTVTRDNRGNTLTSILPVPRTEAYSNFFSHRIIKLWDFLPEDIRNLVLDDHENNKVFKKALVKLFNTMVNDKFVVENTCTWFQSKSVSTVDFHNLLCFLYL